MSMLQPVNIVNWKDRVEELEDYVLTVYGLEPVHTRVIAASLLPTRHPPVWIIMESDHHTLYAHLRNILYRMGIEMAYPHHLRFMRPYKSGEYIDQIMLNRMKPLLLLDTEWRWPTHHSIYRLKMAELERQCLRIRPKPDPVKVPPPYAEAELNRLLQLVIGGEFRPVVEPTPVNEALAIYIHLYSMLEPCMTDSHSNIRNAALLLSSLRELDDPGGMVTESEHHILYRVLRESVHHWEWEVLKRLTRPKSIRQLTATSTVDRTRTMLHEWRAAGLVIQHKYEWRVADKWWADFTAFMNGTARWW